MKLRILFTQASYYETLDINLRDDVEAIIGSPIDRGNSSSTAQGYLAAFEQEVETNCSPKDLASIYQEFLAQSRPDIEVWYEPDLHEGSNVINLYGNPHVTFHIMERA